MSKARTFKLYRPNKAADGISYLPPEVSPLEGCLFSDGSLAVRWMTLSHSTAVWPSLNDFLAVHGHSDYGSYIVWDDTDERYEIESQSVYTKSK
ncbi:MAG TPA: hypothetical protein VJ836_00600 [Candidatus Saccharimonadales bacterium]|nr:hypothetical protein [Candidatus Saccharimonadales bacterium]